MEGMAVLALCCSLYLLYLMCVTLARFFYWLTSPIRNAVARQRVLDEARRKEEELLELHDRTRGAISQTVRNHVALQRQAVQESDRQPGQPQSG
jgi:uncharacterized iron-regulated membrane protein